MISTRRRLLIPSGGSEKPDNSFYWYGDECIDVTGGWVAYNPYYSLGYRVGISEKEADRLKMYWLANNSYSAFFGTVNKINTTGLHYIYMKMTLSGSYQFHFQIDNSHSGWGKINGQIIDTNLARLDVSSHQGDYYLNIGIHQSSPGVGHHIMEAFEVYAE